ncbi:MAG: hypothetical protein AAGF47_11335, partial [Planctomycetota bacterium]
MTTAQTNDVSSATPPLPARRETEAAGLLWPSTVSGFGAAVAVWIAWYLLHLPSIQTPPEAAAPLLLIVMGLTVGWLTRGLGGRAWRVGLGAGLVAGGINLLLLGSKITSKDPATGDASTLVPSAPVIVGGFLIASALIGVIAGAAGGLTRSTGSRGGWLGRFAMIALAALAPLIAIGGAVTSAGAGMAVPDWPG